jgi:endonuclease YncB( thermonuclease family)
MTSGTVRRLLVVALVMGLGAISLWAQGPADLVDRQFRARVVSVMDGDTVEILIPPARRERVRLHGVDAPESGEPYSQVARTFTRVIMFSRDVLVTGKDVDVYGRLVARIVVGDVDASEAIVAEGLACTFRRYVSDPVLDAAQDRAKAGRLGFWAGGAPQPACVARESRLAAVTAPGVGGFIGNVNSRVYHSPMCRNATCQNCTRKFQTRAEAEGAGFRPAGDCLAR